MTSTESTVTTGSAVSLADVSMTYPARRGEAVPALTGVDLDVRRDEFITIVGPSGCGKSTVLKLIAGLVAPSSGTIRIGDHQVLNPSSDVGLVFQQPVLLPWRTVLQNVMLPLQVLPSRQESSRGDRIERAMEMLSLVGLADRAKHYPRELSGGMQQRVSIARGLVHDPKVLLMDEPFGALDAMTRDTMCLELLRIWQQNAKTVLFVTHSIPEAVLLADRVVVMTPGPGRVVDIVDVDLPRPRGNRMINTPEFGDHVAHIRKLLNAESSAY